MLKKIVAEFLGTFVLVFIGTGAAIVNQQTNGTISHTGVAITFGLVVMALIHSLGNISGCHINPAVTIAFTVAGRFKVTQVAPYISSQLAGALAASFILKFLFPLSSTLGATLPSGTAAQSFVLEILLTFFLMLVIMLVATGSKEQGMFAGITIGAVVLIEAMFAGPISGASMNPARSLGPAIVSGNIEHLWVYLIAPIIGAVAAIPISKILCEKKVDEVKV